MISVFKASKKTSLKDKNAIIHLLSTTMMMNFDNV